MEYQALYRQFRPANFDEIVEQKAPVATLRKTVQTGKIGHAYLFCGQRGTGKTSIARVFARAINCEHPVNGNPCNECDVCKGILDGSLMDVIEIDAASNRSIDNIRRICEEVSYAPSRTKYKVYIIDEVHMITTEAFNALLKTLEEPPAHAVFLFATTEPHQIPATILSRCQRFDFRRISVGSIKGRLRYICEKENINAGDDALELIASMSDGAMRDAISLLDQAAAMASGELITPESIEEMTGTVNIDFIADFATILIEGRFDKLPLKCKELADSGRDFIQFTLDLGSYFRNLLIVRVVPDPVTLIPASTKSLKRMYEVANLTNSQTIVGFISGFSKLVSDFKNSPSVRTSFEIGMYRLCGRKVRMEEAPLVIPDFSKLQAEAAQRISEGNKAPVPSAPVVPEVSVSEPDELDEPEPLEAPKPVEPAKPAEPVKPVESVKPTEPVKPAESEEIKDPEPSVLEEKPSEPEVSADSAPIDDDIKIAQPPSGGILGSLEKLEALKAKTAGILGTGVGTAVPEPPVADDPSDPLPWDEPAAPAPSPVEEEEDEDKPMENQIGLIFGEDGDNGTPKVGIFANLSDSVLDDISMEDLEREEENESSKELDSFEPAFGDDLQAPTGRIGETKRTALSMAVDKSPIVQSKNSSDESDPRQKWLLIKSRIYEQDRYIGQVLDSSRLVILGSGAYIVIGSPDTAEAKALGGNPGFRQVSSQIKTMFHEVTHVFSCTGRQYENVERKYISEHPGEEVPRTVLGDDAPASEPVDASDFINSLGAMGLNTEIHFGDE